MRMRMMMRKRKRKRTTKATTNDDLRVHDEFAWH
jgi:hypothetical protein